MSALHTHQQPQLNIGVGLDVGRSRKDKPNQDSVGLYADYCQDPTTLAVKGLLFVVADGMGGAAGGKEASQMAVQLVSSNYYGDPDLLIESSLERAIQEANREIHQRGQSDPFLRGLGTTFVAFVIRNQELVVANVGDSRAYLLRQGELWQLSLDHTAVQEQVREGLLTPEEGSVHPRRHVLSRNLGSRPRAQPDFDNKTLVPGDTLLLCSDGLWGAVSDDEIVEVLQQQRGSEAAQTLVDLANEHGGPDNISVIVVNVGELVASPVHTIAAPVATQRLAGSDTILLERAATPAPARRSLPWAAISAAAVAVVLLGALLLRNTVFGGGGQIAVSPAPSIVAGSSQPSPSSSAEPVAALATTTSVITATTTATARATPAATPTARPTSRPTQEPESAPLAIRQHSGPIQSLVFAPDGQTLALGSADDVVLLDVIGTTFAAPASSASPVIEEQTQTAGTPQASATATSADCGSGSRVQHGLSLAFDAAGEAWAAVPSGTAVELWQISSGRRLFDSIQHPTAVTGAVLSADGKQLASAAENGVVIIRNIDDGTFLTIAAHDSPVCSLAFSSDGAILATGTQDGSLDLWRTGDGQHLETLEQHTGPVTALGFAPNVDPGAQAQHILASVEQDGTLKLWQLGDDTFETSKTATPTPTATRSTATPPASQSPSAQPSAEPLEPTRSHLPFLALDHAAPVSSIAFAPNGRLLASAGQDGVVKLWQIGDQLRDPPAGQSHDSTSTPNSATEPIQRLIHPAPVDSIAFAPDGRTLASGSDDGVVRLWRIVQPQPGRKQTPEPTATTVGRRKSS